MVVLESQALGVPVIAPNFGPFPYAIKHNVNGLLFASGDVESLRVALCHIVEGERVFEKLRFGATESAQCLAVAQSGFAKAVRTLFDSTPTNPGAK
jgi:glycosyltransferase involved in cell wall biosynthesis